MLAFRSCRITKLKALFILCHPLQKLANCEEPVLYCVFANKFVNCNTDVMLDYMTLNCSTAMPSSALFEAVREAEFRVNCFSNIVPLSFHHFNTSTICFSCKTSVFFCAASTCFKGHLLVCQSGIFRRSSLNGYLSEKVTAPPHSSSRSHFQHACGRWLTLQSLPSVCLQGRERPTTHTTLQHIRYYCLSIYSCKTE